MGNMAVEEGRRANSWKHLSLTGWVTSKAVRGQGSVGEVAGELVAWEYG